MSQGARRLIRHARNMHTNLTMKPHGQRESSSMKQRRWTQKGPKGSPTPEPCSHKTNTWRSSGLSMLASRTCARPFSTSTLMALAPWIVPRSIARFRCGGCPWNPQNWTPSWPCATPQEKGKSHTRSSAMHWHVTKLFDPRSQTKKARSARSSADLRSRLPMCTTRPGRL